jgi:NAD(P)H-quinone oxidoreductase subunit 6
MTTFAFFLLATLTLASGSVVAFSKNIIYATVSLLGCFVGIAGLYLQLSADFLAAVQILVYVGGTLTLILFAVMLTSRIDSVRTSNASAGRWSAFVVVGLVLLVLGRLAADGAFPARERAPMPTTAKLGHALLADYLLPFELGSIILLSAMVGAVVLARRAVARSADVRGPRAGDRA